MYKENKVNNANFINTFLSKVLAITNTIAIQEIDDAIELLFDAWKRGNKIFIIGNGGSASTASHFVCDLSKWTCVEGARRLKVLSFSDNVALITALANDEGLNTIYIEQLKAWIEPQDVLISISVHGGVGKGNAGPWSQNIVRAMKFSKKKGVKLLGLCGFDGGVMKQICDVSIIVPDSDPLIGIPLVEGYHLLIQHLICAALRQKIENTKRRHGKKKSAANI
jgi:D-sedoheptulose 7-phosphate isomerase